MLEYYSLGLQLLTVVSTTTTKNIHKMLYKQNYIINSVNVIQISTLKKNHWFDKLKQSISDDMSGGNFDKSVIS